MLVTTLAEMSGSADERTMACSVPADIGLMEARPGLGVAGSGSTPDMVGRAGLATEKVGTVEIATAGRIIPKAVGRRQVTV